VIKTSKIFKLSGGKKFAITNLFFKGFYYYLIDISRGK
jgi:hypothetical protein